MSLRLALIVALLAGAGGCAWLAYDLDRRLAEAALVPAEDPGADAAHALLKLGTPYLSVLGSAAVLNLAALLLLGFSYREERSLALLRAGHQGSARYSRGNPKPAVAGPAPDPGGDVPETSPPAAETPVNWSGGSIVPWKREHAAAFRELWNRVCAEIPQAAPKEEAQFEKFLRSAEFDAESSAVAVAADGSLAGAALALRQPAFEDDGYWWLESPAVVAALLVDPPKRRKGAGRALMQWVEAAARRRQRPRVFVGGVENFPHLVAGVPEHDHALRVFFSSLGYVEVRRTCHMEAEYAGFTPPPELVEREERLKQKGFSFAAARKEDVPAFQVFLEQAKLDRPQRRLEKFTGEPERFFLAWHEGRVVGFIHVTSMDERGRSGIHLIYFLKEFRGAGLGSVLLIKAHELWKTMGAAGGTIWTYPEAAVRFYPRAGFRTVQEWICYGKDLDHAWTESAFVNRWR
ncbi:MAG: GNAT family N-acetyltransferase [Planctomycetes bacterium]|nr:GNAT family N-acetyltransferase [Planctomycetota bacterium]